MLLADDIPRKVVPAQLGFLAIYNPSLGTTDQTLDDQIVYYSSSETRKAKRRAPTSGSGQDRTATEENERLRQVGLAQGMVEFAKTFSDGKSMDSVETEKSRIILHELEAGWWILASIDLTQIPKATQGSNGKGKPADEITIEYSAREVKPPELLLQDLLRAHSVFLLHHASSISALFVRSRRSKFINILGRYWDEYLSTWNVMLHGNPAAAVYGGIKLASSGELGIGVGEEERGSGEREVLEGFVGRVEGLVDLVVSRFGDTVNTATGERGIRESLSQSQMVPNQPWLGTGAEPGAADGAVFLGVGALSRKSLRDVTHWMEDLYSWGPRAYGVMDNPTSTRHQHRKKRRPLQTSNSEATITQSVMYAPSQATPRSSTPKPKPSKATKQKGQERRGDAAENVPKSPLRTVIPVDAQPDSAGAQLSSTVGKPGEGKTRPIYRRTPSSKSSTHSLKTGKGKFVDYLKMGYGTHWNLSGGIGKAKAGTSESVSSIPPSVRKAPTEVPDQQDSNDSAGAFDKPHYSQNDSMGHFLVGLLGDINSEGPSSTSSSDESSDNAANRRLLVRTVTVELERASDARAEADISIDLSTADGDVLSTKNGSSQHTGTSHASSFEGQDRNKTKKLRVVIYVNKPFIYTLLFELRTDALALPGLYRSLHVELAPLQRPLLDSTSQPLARPDLSSAAASDARIPIFDLIWDPTHLTISCTIPNIPPPAQSAVDSVIPWSRLEALNTHTQILNMYNATRSEDPELERTCKTSRGYWVVWTRVSNPEEIPSPSPKPSPGSITPIYESIAAERGSSSKKRNKSSSNKGRRTSERGVSVMHSATSQSTTSVTKSSMYSGPAHPFLEVPSQARQFLKRDKEIWLVRKASEVTGLMGARDERAGLAKGIGVDTTRYVEGLLDMMKL